MDKKIPFHRATVMLHQSSRACVAADVNLEATLHSYIYDEHQVVPVTFRNLTTQTVSAAPTGILCEIQPVEAVDTCQKSEKTSPVLQNIFSKIHLPDDLTYEEHQECQKMVTDFKDISRRQDTLTGSSTILLALDAERCKFLVRQL